MSRAPLTAGNSLFFFGFVGRLLTIANDLFVKNLATETMIYFVPPHPSFTKRMWLTNLSDGFCQINEM